MKALTLVAMIVLPVPAVAADEPSPRISVSGTGSVATPPDRATIGYGVHGEGATSDEAVTAMVAKRKAIDGGLAGFAGRPAPHASNATIAEVRGRDCNRNAYGNARLSTGECAIIGYTADLAMEATTAQVTDAATIVGLIGRLGGQNPRIQRFFLVDDAPARRRAVAIAFAEARREADAIATAGGVRLGPLLTATDGSFVRIEPTDIVVTASRIEAPAPPPPPPPVPVDISPRPIDTQARVTLTYAIAP